MNKQIQYIFPEDISKRRCGCYIRRPIDVGIKFERALVPLKHIDYHLEIVNSLLNITLSQKYFNPTEKFLEVDFSLPISPESSIYKFEAEFGNVKIHGIVKEKEEAKKEYEKAKSEGKQAVIGTIDPNSKDILNLEIGNIPPKTEFTVTISLLQEMKISQNTFYRIQIPSTISPRYMNRVEGEVKVPEHMKDKGHSSGKADFTWSFKVDLKTTRKVVFFDSPSHDVTLLNQNENGTETLLVMAKNQTPNKDFTFVYTTEDFHLPSYVVGSTDTSSTVMLSFIPKFCNLEITDAYKASLDNKPFETDMAAAKGDYVFFLDRSGSMGGTRIEKAKEALILFMKSLPEDSYFNVISFGSGSERMFPTSQKYDSQKIKQAVQKVKSMKADLGGTEIYHPLSTLLQEKVQEGYPRHVFLLTDGGVGNTQGVIHMVKKSTKFCRVHSIGIGNGASYDLIQGCAEGGKGKFIMIADDENPAEKIIELLETTLTPLISKVDLKCDQQNQIESIVPNPKSIPYILKDDVVNFFVTFPGPMTDPKHFTFEYEDSVTKLPYKATIVVQPDSINQPFVDKMAHLKVLRSLENSAKDGVSIEDQIYFVKVKDYKEEAIKYSVKHQVLSEYTAFICVGKELVDGQYQEFKNKGTFEIHVEKPIPIEYEQQHVMHSKKRSMPRAQANKGVAMMSAKPMMMKTMNKQSSGLGIGNTLGSIGSSISSSLSGLMGMATSSKKSSTSNFAAKQKKEMQHDEDDQQQFDEMHIQRQKCQTRERKKKMACTQQVSDMKKLDRKSQIKGKNQKEQSSINQIIQLQAADGSWNAHQLIEKLAKNPKQVAELSKKFDATIVITKLVVLWMQKNHREKQYALIIKKAQAWLKKKLAEQKIEENSLNAIEVK